MTLLSATEIKNQIEALPGWELKDDGTLYKQFKFGDFSRALLFINAVGYLSEMLNHRPHVQLNAEHVSLALLPHSIGGLTQEDFVLAERVEALFFMRE